MEKLLTQTNSRIIIGDMEYVSVEEASEITGYVQDHLRRLIRQKKINATKKGAMWWVELESLQEYKRKMDELGNDKFFTWRED